MIGRITYSIFNFNDPEIITKYEFDNYKSKIELNPNLNIEPYDTLWRDLIIKIIGSLIFWGVLLKIFTKFPSVIKIVTLGILLTMYSLVIEFISIIKYKFKKKVYYYSLRQKIVKANTYTEFIKLLENKFEDKNVDLIESSYKSLTNEELIELSQKINDLTPLSRDLLTKIIKDRNIDFNNYVLRFGGLTMKEIQDLSDLECNNHLSKLSKDDLEKFHSQLLKD